MKKAGLLVLTLSLSIFTLTGCNNKCECENVVDEPAVDENAANEVVEDEDAVLNQRIEYCNEHGGTHLLVHSPTAVLGECSFPGGVTCEDTTLGTDECNFESNLENIDN